MAPSRARQLAEGLLEQGATGDFRLSMMARLDQGFNDAALLGLLSRAGVCCIQWGLESGSSRVLQLMNKGTAKETGGAILQKATEQGISNQCFLMVGFPGETREEAQQTVDFLEQKQKYIDLIVEFGSFELSAQSPIGRDPSRWGVTVFDDGSWTPPAGALHKKEADDFHQTLVQKMQMGITRPVSGRYFLWSWTLMDEVVFFLMSAQGWLDADEVLRRLRTEEDLDFYPVLAASPLEGPDQVDLFPLDLRESTLINRIKAIAPRRLTSIEAANVHLAHRGSITVRELVQRLSSSENGPSEEKLRAAILGFWAEAFRQRWALAFRRPWHPPQSV
jgi:hypothetical protein